MTEPKRRALRFAIAYALLAPLYLAPLFATRFLPALDLPHHLAIADALAKAASPSSPYAKLYEVQLRPAPFDAHFLALVALSSWMSLGAAAKLLVGVQVLALPLACARLLAATGRSTIPALLAFPLGYAMPVHYGLLAFVLAVPVLVWVLAEAADETAWTERPGRRAARLAAALLLLFFAHLEAYAFGLAAAVLAVAAHRVPRARRALGLVAALPSLAAWALYVASAAPDGAPPSGSVSRSFFAAALQEIRQEGLLGHLASRVRGVPVHLLRGFDDGADVRASLAYFAIVFGIALTARLVRPEAGPRPRPRLAVAGLGLVALGAYLLLPHHVHPHAHSIYPRFAVMLAVTALLAIPPRLARARPRALDLVAAMLVLAAVLQAWVLRREYAAFGRELADFETLLEALPPGHASAGLVYDPESGVMNVDGILSGVPAYYATERPGPGTSTYLYYCEQPHLPCRLRAPDAPPALPHFMRPEDFDARRALQDVDLLLVRGGPGAQVIFGSESARVRLAAQAGRWRAFVRP
jgi:hypothetical protein